MKVPDIVPQSVSTPETLYVMADEKYIGSQNTDKDIMVKCFVTFEDVQHISKNRNMLTNRFVFSTCSKNLGKFLWIKLLCAMTLLKLKILH